MAIKKALSEDAYGKYNKIFLLFNKIFHNSEIFPFSHHLDCDVHFLKKNWPSNFFSQIFSVCVCVFPKKKEAKLNTKKLHQAKAHDTVVLYSSHTETNSLF